MMKIYYFLIFSILFANLSFAQVTYNYDAAGNRIQRGNTSTPISDCYTLTRAGTAKRLTNYAGVPKLMDVNATVPASQVWKLESVGAHLKLSSQGGVSTGGTSSTTGVNNSLGVESGGNAVDNPVKLLSYGSGGDHLLWTRMAKANGDVFERKNSTLIFGVTQGFGDGVGVVGGNAAISDLNLTSDPVYAFGANKWVVENATCPVAVTCPTFTASANNASPVAGASINLNASCSGDCAGVTYLWKLGTTTVGTAANITGVVVSSTPGSYTYVLTTTKSGCATLTTNVVVNVQPALPNNCYTLTRAGTTKRLTNYAGVPKLMDVNTAVTQSQIWKLEVVGTQLKITSQGAVSTGGTSSTTGVNYALGVDGGGNSVDNPVKLLAYGSGGDHLLWTRMAKSNGDVFERKNSTLIFGVTQGFGDGVGVSGANAAISDLNLTSDPDYLFGANKWVVQSATCPAGLRIGIFDDIITSVDNESIIISPNPNAGDFNIDFELGVGKQGTLALLNTEGKIVYQKNVHGQRLNQQEIKLGILAPGIYVMRLTTQGESRTAKIVIVR